MNRPHFLPAPWTIAPGQKPPHYLFVYGPKGQSIGMLFDRPNEAERNANANLIEQAPALAELLAIALDEYEQHNGYRAAGPHWSVKARQVLERAGSDL